MRLLLSSAALGLALALATWAPDSAEAYYPPPVVVSAPPVVVTPVVISAPPIVITLPPPPPPVVVYRTVYVQPPPPPPSVVTVALRDCTFDPASLNVSCGMTIRWVNTSCYRHTVTSCTGLFDSCDIPPGGVFSAKFVSPGIYRYYSRYQQATMQGVIVVQ